MLMVFLACTAIQTNAPDPSKLESWIIADRGIALTSRSTIFPFAYPELQQQGKFTAIARMDGRNLLVVFDMNTRDIVFSDMNANLPAGERDPSAISYAGKCEFKKHASLNGVM